MKRTILLSLLLGLGIICQAQVFVEKQTRHRFAQLNLGLDVEMTLGGQTQYLNAEDRLLTLDLNNTFRPRFLIGGTHFWGHADFYIAIPLLYPSEETENQVIQHLRGVETAFKYYPWQITNQKIRPFVGVSFAPFYFEQDNNNLEFGNGAEINRIGFPLLFGLTYNRKNQLMELGAAWNYSNERDYYLTRTRIEKIKMPPFLLSLSYRWMLDTTLGAEKNWENGRTKEVTAKLAEQKKLDGFYVGVGMSSAFWLRQSSYNKVERPYIKGYGISLMPDFTAGYYWNNLDMNVGASFRSYRGSANVFGVNQNLKRRSFVLEATKYLFDYHGFVPFVGPAVSYENLSFVESFERTLTFDVNEQKISYGLTFGWDIRPNRLQSWILRTNLRWWPDLNLTLNDDRKINFNNLEFNFIQMVIYPSRIF